MTSRVWCFTCFDTSWSLSALPTGVQYCVYEHELCPTSGRQHLQGFFRLRSSCRLLQARSLLGLPLGTHMEKARGTDEENRTYCTKTNDRVVELGSLVTQGQRTDLEEIKVKVLQAGAVPIAEIRNFQQLRFAQGLLAYATCHSGPRKVWWLHGKTGTGKTRAAVAKFPDAWITSDSLKWFDAYNGQEAAIFDDFRPCFCAFSFLLRLLDRYPLRVQIKGGFVPWNVKYIIITCNKSPADCWYAETRENIDQLLRRIDVIIDFDALPQGQMPLL